MQVRISAFELTPPQQIPLIEFLNYLHSVSSDEFENYFIPVTKKDGFFVGLALLPKDMKAFCKFRRQAKKFKINSEALEAGTNIADFNFFLINPNTGRGLYSHYRGATSAREFCFLLKRRWADFKQAARKASVDALDDVHKTGQETAITKKYSGYLATSLIYKPKTFHERLQAMAHISEFDYTITTFEPIAGAFTPLAQNVERVSASVRFSQNASALQLKNIIKSVLEKDSIRSASVYGTNQEGEDVAYRLFNDVDVLETFDFDHFISNLSIDSQDLDGTLQKSDIVSALLTIANSKSVKALLSTKAK